MENIMDLAKNDNARKEAGEFVAKLYKEDKDLFDRAISLVEELGLDGLWSGVELAIMVTAKALIRERKQLIPISKKVGGEQ